MDSIMLDIAKRSGFVSARSGLESSKTEKRLIKQISEIDGYVLASVFDALERILKIHHVEFNEDVQGASDRTDAFVLGFNAGRSDRGHLITFKVSDNDVVLVVSELDERKFVSQLLDEYNSKKIIRVSIDENVSVGNG